MGRRKSFGHFLAAVSVAAALCLTLEAAAQRGEGPSPEGVARKAALERLIAYLESPDRAKWQKPEKVIRALELKKGQTVTDLGSGTGYFTRPLAKAVGKGGRVDALDVDPRLLSYLLKTIDHDKIDNVRLRRVLPEDPEIPPASTDLVFLCNAYHELRDRVAYMEKVAPGLKAGGRIAIVDFHKRANIPEGPPLEEKIDRETVVDELRQAGFELAGEQSFLPYQYFLMFRPTRGHSFDTFTRSVSTVMRSSAPEKEKQQSVESLLAAYLGGRTLDEKFQRPHPGLAITTYLLYADPGGAFSVAALVFQPHAQTPIHDHQSWVVWGTYSGRERETRFRREDSAGESFPELTPAWSRVFSAGEVSFIDPPPGDVHAVENVDDAVSVSLHVHATDISKQVRNSYDVKTKTVRAFVQSYEPGM